MAYVHQSREQTAINTCLSCQEPPKRCDQKGVPCPYTRQFGQWDPVTKIQHTAGVNVQPERIDFRAIDKAANRTIKKMGLRRGLRGLSLEEL